jgi:hypothetical protein
MEARGMTAVQNENICIVNDGKNPYLQSSFGRRPKHGGVV